MDGDAERFKVTWWFNSPEQQYFWGIYDCGPSGWTNCSLKSGGPSASNLGDVVGTVDSEVNYGGSACTIEMMGSSVYRVRFGETGDPIEGQANLGSWAVQPLNYYNFAACPDYVSGGPDAHTDEKFRTYDTRN